MIDFIAPRYYASERGAIAKTGALIAPMAKRLFITAGRTALSVVRDDLLASLDTAGIVYTVYEYRGYPTHEEAKSIAAKAAGMGAEAIAGVGGGRVIDTAKAAGHYASLPVAAIPTIAATCACWAPVSVMYSPDGVVTGPLYNENSPRLIIADIDVISSAPPRYLRSGIADTLAKWYESYPNLKTSGDFYLRLVVKYGEFARGILETLGLKVSDDLSAGICLPDEIAEVVDCIFAIAGLCGAVRGLADTQGIAHPFYNACSALPELRDKLHGEKVAFGLVMQAVLENRDAAETEHRIAVFNRLNIPLTLRELGLEPGFDEKFAVIEPIIRRTTPIYPGLERPWTGAELRNAILTATRLAE
ncbi:MAG: iron-containing alcohol dehydrogenase family protein [Spirochaetaceae bacterium]|jgi:glycerol dehydrogenase|nr:iron-containing alcohol dehydrogenase family protein [Spirochaetaceae bacterium]